jgi:hypothetical protein
MRRETNPGIVVVEVPAKPSWCEIPNTVGSGRLSRSNTKAKFFSRSHDAVIRVYNDAGKGGRPPLVAPNIERRAIPVPDAHSCVLGAPF